jgi:hypothetical protein
MRHTVQSGGFMFRLNRCIIAFFFVSTSAVANDRTAEVDLDYRYFLNPAASASPDISKILSTFGVTTDLSGAASGSFPAPPGFNKVIPGQEEPSVAVTLNFINEWNGRSRSFVFKPFFRYDNMDEYRTHFDIREMVWTAKYSQDEHPWMLKIGIDKVFWGTAESHHLDDVINQTDLVEDISGEAKLGQPMARITMDREWGVLDFFILPWFRERTFTGPNGRLHPPGFSLALVPNVYEAKDGNSHVDYALHWAKTFHNVDIALSQFVGTNRDPRLTQDSKYRTIDNIAGYVLSYDQMSQTGVDISVLLGDWIIKAESLHRDTHYDHYWAGVAGIEYPFFSVFKTSYDVSTFIEFNYDSRGATALYQSDVFTGLNINFNNSLNTQIKAGLLTDTTDKSRSTRFDLSSRIVAQWSMHLVGQFYNTIAEGNPLYQVKSDSFVQASLTRYF